MARYVKVFLLGSGSFGKAWLVEAQNSSKDQKVLKEIKLAGLGGKAIDQALTEVSVLARCKHTNIIGYTEAFVSKNSLVLSIIMDYASGGDLHKEITQRRGLYFSNEIVLRWFSQLISALSYIHNRGILHRDVKPQNLFLDERHVLKLGDFGISRILHGDADVAVTFIGTPFYLSPEICRQQSYSYKSDMWSAGCVLYEMCCLHVPFTAVNLPSLIVQIQIGQYSPLPSHCDELMCYLVSSLMTSDAEKRLSADDILLFPTIQACLKESPESKAEIFKAVSDLTFEEKQLSLATHRIGKKRNLESNEKESTEECCSYGGSPVCQNEAFIKQAPGRTVCNSTYTVVKHPKVRRLSFASPKLSAVLEKQRALSAETQRENRTKKHKLSPRLNLLQAVQNMKSKDGGSGSVKNDTVKKYCNFLESLTDIVYSCVVVESRPHDAKAEILSLLQESLGQQLTQGLISAVRNKVAYRDLQERFDIQPFHVQALLWYVKLNDSLHPTSVAQLAI